MLVFFFFSQAKTSTTDTLFSAPAPLCHHDNYAPARCWRHCVAGQLLLMLLVAAWWYWHARPPSPTQRLLANRALV